VLELAWLGRANNNRLTNSMVKRAIIAIVFVMLH
jgi:hypothetical protein